jgi:hypothetical protein
VVFEKDRHASWMNGQFVRNAAGGYWSITNRPPELNLRSDARFRVSRAKNRGPRVCQSSAAPKSH